MNRLPCNCLLVLMLISMGYLMSAPVEALDEDLFRQRLQNALMLTPEQGDSLRFLRADLEAELALLRSDVQTGALLAIEGRIRYREIMNAYRLDRRDIFTEEQRLLLERAQQLARDRLLTDGLPPQKAPLEQLPEALDLTTDQVARWRALLARQRTEVAEIREAGETLQPEDYRRLRESHRIAFESMLSSQQRLTLEQIRHRWRSERELAEAMPDSLVIHDDLPFPDDFEDFDAPIQDGPE